VCGGGSGCRSVRADLVDANQAYSVDGALRMARRLIDLEVTVFEHRWQPTTSPAFGACAITARCDRLDESLRHPTDLATFVKLDAIDIAIAKVQRSGGLTLSRRLCQLAEDAACRSWVRA